MKKIFLLLQILWGAMAIAQPTGSCTTGATQLGTDGILYGCVETNWRRLSELSVVTNSNLLPINQGITKNVDNSVFVREMDSSIRAIRNVHFNPITLSGHIHQIGKIIYDNTTKHFYQGVNDGKWHRIDNGSSYPDGVSISGFLMPQGVTQAQVEYAFFDILNGPQSCDDPTLLNRILTKAEEAAMTTYQNLDPSQRQNVVHVYYDWGGFGNPCGFSITSQTVPW